MDEASYFVSHEAGSLVHLENDTALEESRRSERRGFPERAQVYLVHLIMQSSFTPGNSARHRPRARRDRMKPPAALGDRILPG